MANMTKEEAYRAGYENPLMGSDPIMQRLYGTIGAIGSELGGGDMGTPFGQRFTERQKATKAEVKRLQELSKKFPNEFGQGMADYTERNDPYMLNQALPGLYGMRPGVTTFSQVAGPQRLRQGAGVAAEAEAPQAAPGIGYAPRPAEPYYRNVPPEMGTSPGPMNAFNQNMYGMTTGRYGSAGAQYAPEMAVTDFESYGPMGARPTPGPYAPSGFDRNMLAAYRQGRYNRMAGGRPAPMGGDYTLEELGSAVAPYRQGGLVYEPVGGQGAGPRQIGGPGAAPRLGYERGPIEGEFSEVYGLGGPQARPGYGGSMDFGVTRDGMVTPRADRMNFGPSAHMAGATAGAIGIDQMASMRDYLDRQASRELPPFNPNIPVPMDRGGYERLGLGPVLPQTMESYTGMRQPFSLNMGPVMPMGATALSGQTPGAGAVFEQPAAPAGRTEGRRAGGRKAEGGKGAPTPPRRPQDLTAETPFDPNLNYLVTQALDQLLGGDEARTGRHYQEYYATNPWPY